MGSTCQTNCGNSLTNIPNGDAKDFQKSSIKILSFPQVELLKIQQPNKILNDTISIGDEEDSIDSIDENLQPSYQSSKEISLRSQQYIQIPNQQGPVQFLSQKKLAIQTPKLQLKIQPSIFIHIRNEPIYQYYKVDKCIGVGSYGTVYKVTHKASNQTRAMKQIGKLKQNRKVLKEMGLLTKLDHPNILRPIELFEDLTTYQMVTELLTGGDLEENVSDRPFDENRASFVFRQLVYAVSYLHSSKIIHRDIKPENIIFTNKNINSSIKLIDFGIAKKVCGQHLPKKRIGTLCFMAPEVLSGKYSFSADMWACGITLYYMLVGKIPFKIKDQQTHLSTIQNKLSSLFNSTNLSPLAEDLIINLLQINPSKRFTPEQALQHPWITQAFLNSRLYSTELNSTQLSYLYHNISEYCKQNIFVKVVLGLVVHSISNVDRNLLIQNAFYQMDKDLDGKISKEEFISQLQQYGTNEGITEILDNLFSTLLNGNLEYFTYSTFLSATAALDKLQCPEIRKLLFNLLDVNQDGLISYEDFQYVVGVDASQKSFNWTKQTIITFPQFDNFLK